MAAPGMKEVSISAFLSAFGDEAGDAVEFVRSDAGDLATKQGGDDLFGRTFEESFDKVAEGGAPGDIARNGGDVDVAQAVLFVADVALFFEDAELRADGRVARLGFGGDSGKNVADGSAFQFVENVHDLAFAAGEGAWLGLLRHMLVFQHVC